MLKKGKLLLKYKKLTAAVNFSVAEPDSPEPYQLDAARTGTIS
jgi:hypothetical protein